MICTRIFISFYDHFNSHLISQDDETIEKTKITHQVASKLGTRLQGLVHFLFDIASMTNALLEFEVGLNY